MAAVKLTFVVADAVTTQLPEAVKVTTPLKIEQDPETAKVGCTPDDAPVTVDTALALGVYVPPETGDVGTVEVKASVWPA